MLIIFDKKYIFFFIKLSTRIENYFKGNYRKKLPQNVSGVQKNIQALVIKVIKVCLEEVFISWNLY